MDINLSSFNKPKYYFIALMIFVILYYFTFNDVGKSSNNEENVNKEPPIFVLTEMNNRELEEEAYFTIKYDNTFELKTGDGTIFKYTPTSHFGDDPLCNILAKDDRGRNTAICIKNLGGLNVMIMLENDEMISNFKGHKK